MIIKLKKPWIHHRDQQVINSFNFPDELASLWRVVSQNDREDDQLIDRVKNVTETFENALVVAQELLEGALFELFAAFHDVRRKGFTAEEDVPKLRLHYTNLLVFIVRKTAFELLPYLLEQTKLDFDKTFTLDLLDGWSSISSENGVNNFGRGAQESL